MQTVDETIREVARRFAWPARRSGDLLCGRGSDPVQRVVVCVNSAEVERVEDEHALILVASEVATLVRGRAYSRVVAGRSVSHVLQQAAERHQSLLVAPEMLHFGAGGFDARLVEALGLQDVRVAAPRRAAGFRLVGFVPPAHLDAVRDACFAAGAGQIGEYDSCSWSNPGTGTFRGSDHSQPSVGEPGQLETVEELRLEVVCHSREEVDLAVQAFVAAHPYEEPAYDVYAVSTPTSGVGAGRAGRFGGSLDEFVQALTALTRSVPQVMASGRDVLEPASELAVVATCGDASEVVDAVLFAGELEEAVVLCTSAEPEARTALRGDGHSVVVAPADALLRVLADRLDIEHDVTDELSDEVVDHARRSIGVEDQGTLWAGTSQPVAAVHDDGDAHLPAPDTLYFDGGSRGNPGPAAFGFSLLSSGDEVEGAGDFIGEATNNVAEYTGLIEGVRRALELGATRLDIHSDSELVVKQVHGEYKVKNAGIKPLHAEALEVLGRLDEWTLQHVRRADNSRADDLVNQALDAQDVTTA